jgi:hypothetical protein
VRGRVGEKKIPVLGSRSNLLQASKKTAFIVLYKIPGQIFWTAAIDCLWKEEYHCGTDNLCPEPAPLGTLAHKAGLGERAGNLGLSSRSNLLLLSKKPP